MSAALHLAGRRAGTATPCFRRERRSASVPRLRWPALLLALLLAPASAPAGAASGAQTAATADSPAAAVHEHERAMTVEAELPGRLLGLAPACGLERRCRGVWLLVRPLLDASAAGDGATRSSAVGSDAAGDSAARPPRLLLLASRAALGGPAALAESSVPPPADADTLALADLDGDGAAELLAGAPGRVWSLGDPAHPRPARLLLDDPSFDLAASHALLDPALPLLPSPAVGRLRWYRLAGGLLEPAGSAPLPVGTRRRAHGLELTSPEPARLPAAAGAPPRWVAGPDPHGDRRLRSILLDPLSAGEAPAESWSMLPAPERVESARYLTLDGAPALAVFTHPADRLGIFDQARLRLFRLGADRTRAGSAPILAVDTTSHRWQRAAVSVADLDGDGRDEVSVAQIKGLGGKAILIETYRGLGGGRFERRPARVRLDLPDAIWRWTGDHEADLDGDRLPDLVALSGGGLMIYTSTGRREGTALAERPRWKIALPEPEPEEATDESTGGDAGAETAEEPADEREVEVEAGDEGAAVRADRRLPGLGGFPALRDLDGDGRPELIFRDALPDGRERLRVVLLR